VTPEPEEAEGIGSLEIQELDEKEGDSPGDHHLKKATRLSLSPEALVTPMKNCFPY
jgi:hypothetical protein